MSEQITPMTPHVLTQAVLDAYEMRQPLMIWGPPGVGKSQVVAQAAEKLSIGMHDVRVSQSEPADAGGIPYVVDGEMKLSKPWFLADEASILFLDELTDAPTQATYGAYSKIVLDRKAGIHRLHPDVGVVAAGNRIGDRASSTREMPTQLANRFDHVVLIPSVSDWMDWSAQAGVHAHVRAYIQARGEDALWKFDPQSPSKAYATPRSWERCSNFIKHLDAGGRDYDEYARIRLEGIVGRESASEYIAFIRVFDELTPIAEIKADPANAPVPQTSNAAYAQLLVMVDQYGRDWADGWFKYVERFPLEYQGFAVADALRKYPAPEGKKNGEFSGTKAFGAWALANQNLVK